MNKLLSIIVTFLFLFTFTVPLNVLGEENTLAHSYQLDRQFPEENPTSREFARHRDKFKSYSGTGSLIIENYGAQSAEIYINGQELNVSLPKEDNQLLVDISAYTVDGENTIKVLNVQPENSYIVTKIPYPTLMYSTPEAEGFSTELLSKVDDLINKEIDEGFPGAALLIIKDGKIIKNTAYGYSKLYDENGLLEDPEVMTTETLFDLASNTKMYATNLALKKLVSEDKIDLDEYVSVYLPEFTGEGRENIKVRNLLEHNSGLNSSIKFYQEDTGAGPEFFSQDRDTTLDLLNKAPLTYETGSKYLYSDTGFMILGSIIENVTGMRLDEYVEENIYEPIGLENTLFNPLEKGFEKTQCAATETNGNTRGNSREFPNIRTATIQGEVHDEKAYYSLGGVAGHAGLFSTTEDLAVLCQLVLNKGGYGTYTLCDENTFDSFMNISDTSTTIAQGWNKASDGGRLWMFSPYASSSTIGHTGWTGTLTVIDPEYDMAIVLLTNKKNSVCTDGKFEGDKFETGLYGSITSLIYEAFLDNRANSIEDQLDNLCEQIKKLEDLKSAA